MSRPDIDEAAFRARLLARRRELEELDAVGEAGTKPVELDQQAVGRLSRMDAMQVQAMAIASRNRRRNEASRIGNALARLDGGDFGYCVTCDEEIEIKRLHFDPTTLTCLACAAEKEG
jgi:DnaK suppressor protein